jgi:O-antigen/teichoic acid export membrane protein
MGKLLAPKPEALTLAQLKTFLKDTFIYGIAAVLPKAINVLLVGLHTDTLSTGEYSVNTLFYVWIAFLNILLTYGMETAFFRFYNTEKDPSKVLSTSFFSLLISSIVALALLLYFSSEIADFMGFQTELYFQLMISIAIMDAMIIIPFAYLRVQGKSISYAMFRLLNISIYALLNVFFLWYLPNRINAGVAQNELFFGLYNPSFKEGYIFIANLVASAFSFLIILPFLGRLKWQFDLGLWKKMLAYAWPVLVAGLAYTINENLDKLFLENRLGGEVMGAYAGAYKIGVIMSLFILAFRLGAEPFFFNKAKDDNAKETYAIITKWFSIVGSLLVLFIVVFIYPIAGIFLKQDSYFQALNIVPIILLANLFLGIYNNLSVWYKVTNKTRFGMYISVIGAFLTIGGLIYLIPVFGYIGAAYATFIAYFCMMLISYLWSKKHYDIPYQKGRIFIYLILSSLFSYLSFYVFKSDLISGIGLILILCLIVLFSEKKDLSYLRSSL